MTTMSVLLLGRASLKAVRSQSPSRKLTLCVTEGLLYALFSLSVVSVGEFRVRILLNKRDCLAIPPIKLHLVYKNFGG